MGSTRRLSQSSDKSSRIAPSPLLHVLTLEPQLHRLRDERASPALRCILFAGPLSAKVSMYADIIVFMTRHLNIKAVKKAVEV